MDNTSHISFVGDLDKTVEALAQYPDGMATVRITIDHGRFMSIDNLCREVSIMTEVEMDVLHTVGLLKRHSRIEIYGPAANVKQAFDYLLIREKNQ